MVSTHALDQVAADAIRVEQGAEGHAVASGHLDRHARIFDRVKMEFVDGVRLSIYSDILTQVKLEIFRVLEQVSNRLGGGLLRSGQLGLPEDVSKSVDRRGLNRLHYSTFGGLHLSRRHVRVAANQLDVVQRQGILCFEGVAVADRHVDFELFAQRQESCPAEGIFFSRICQPLAKCADVALHDHDVFDSA